MNDFKKSLVAGTEYRRPPFIGDSVEILGKTLPPRFIEVLRVADGLITTNRSFRVFGMSSDERLPNLHEWNDSDWKRGYGRLSQGIIFVAEDIFGDQYGFRFTDEEPRFVKFFCEGGKCEDVPTGITRFLRALFQPDHAGLIDWRLMQAACRAGLKPNAEEHLAFRVPLVIGGNYDVSNLCVEHTLLHLGTLAQISLRNATLPDGTRIKGFYND